MSSAIALFASSRRNGNTGQLIDRIAAELDMEVVDLGSKRLSAYDYEHRNRDDDFEPLMKRVLGFEQIIFASPVYWYAASPTMKVFLDRISDFLELPDLLSDGRRLRGNRSSARSQTRSPISECDLAASLTRTAATATFLRGTASRRRHSPAWSEAMRNTVRVPI